jgi:DNA topoisomerase VI subunit B
MPQTLARTTFQTSRLLKFFSEKELQMQIGFPKEQWPIALLKEVIDHPLNACETTGILPHIEVIVEPDSVSVRDNGPGLPVKPLKHSLDYLVRVSDKVHYVSPSRGQLGNALKCLWAAPYVAHGEQGYVEVVTSRHPPSEVMQTIETQERTPMEIIARSIRHWRVLTWLSGRLLCRMCLTLDLAPTLRLKGH